MSAKARSVLITGTSRGLGLEMVRQFAETQRPLSALFACCLDPANSEELQALAKKHSDIIKVIQMDVADPVSIKQAAAQVASQLGPSGLNLIINNAAIAVYTTVLKSSAEDMINCYKTNTVGPMCIIQEFLPLLRAAAKDSGISGMSCHKAAVVNISTNLSSNELVEELYAKLPMVPYRCSKAALNMVTSCVCLELREEQILCALLHPGWVRTQMGGSDGEIEVEESIGGMINVMNSMTEKNHGALVNYKGLSLPW